VDKQKVDKPKKEKRVAPIPEELGAVKPIESVLLGSQPLSPREKALVEEAYARFALFRDGCREIHDRARESRTILLLQDPRQDAPNTPAERRTLQMQTLKSTFNNCIADQMDNLPEAVMLPERSEMQDIATDMTDVLHFILEQNDFEGLHRRRAEDLFCTGTAVTQIAWDDTMDQGRGDVALIRWPVEAFLWDPCAEDIQDARALIKVSWHPLSWYAEHYPDVAPHVGTDPGYSDGVGVPDSYQESGGDEPRAMMMEYWYRRFDARTHHYTVNVAYLAGGALLWHEEDVYAHGLYPFVVDVFTPIEGLPVGEGMVQELAPMMRYINRYAHYIDENLRMAAKARLLVRKSAKIDQAALTDWQQNIIEGEAIGPEDVQWLQSKPLSAMAGQQMSFMQSDLKQDSGQNQFSRGETAGGVTAATAIASLQEAGGKITRLRTATLMQGFKRMAEQVLWLVSEFYSGKKERLITGRDGKPRAVMLNADYLMGKRADGTLPAPPYSVQVQTQRRNPMRVQAQNELILQAYQMAAQAGVPIPLSQVFEMLSVDGKDRMIPILQQTETTQEQMQALQQQNAQLAQQVDSLKKGLAATAGAMQAKLAGSAPPTSAASAQTQSRT